MAAHMSFAAPLHRCWPRVSRACICGFHHDLSMLYGCLRFSDDNGLLLAAPKLGEKPSVSWDEAVSAFLHSCRRVSPMRLCGLAMSLRRNAACCRSCR